MTDNKPTSTLTAFLPGIVILAFGILPFLAMDALHKVFGWDLDGPGMFWGMAITVPSLFIGCLALIVGLITFLLRRKSI